jgi:hypothetical protein
MTGALTAVVIGLLLFAVAVVNWRNRRNHRISLIEGVVMKIADQRPLPLTRFDRVFQWFQIVMGIILGSFFAIVGIAMLFDFRGS